MTISNLVGKRVRVITMVNENDPVESGTLGTIRHVGYGVINVDWDNGRSLGLIEGEDTYEILGLSDYERMVIVQRAETK